MGIVNVSIARGPGMALYKLRFSCEDVGTMGGWDREGKRSDSTDFLKVSCD
jgi:hypothetical protein